MAAARRADPPAAVARFRRVKVLVAGDLMLDHFVWGTVDRISPEAPVPVVRVTAESRRLGGAANVVHNIRALGGAVVACGVVGADAAGRDLLDELRRIGADASGVVQSRAAVTTRKTRIIAHQQQVVRLDREDERRRDSSAAARARGFLLAHLGDADVVVISDYGKGLVTPELLAALAAVRRRRPFPLLIDPKKTNFAHYRGASLLTPNRDEASQAAGIEIRDAASLARVGAELLSRWEAEAVLITRGEQGMSLFARGAPARHFPTVARHVYDVTGAGDTVVAACALALGAGASLETAAVLANHAAGIVVGEVGTATVSAAQLRADLKGQGRVG
ncbi:MAG TPA: D-glycero-beta-D-manno-heptose-7-phosphate kinase [Candidatus Dormibacteraeota bacterium]|nr:D-glycero-beta-D-manno-heptose-7-phosphate kinase [Candidatus Dormibacteraeota bacterium]